MSVVLVCLACALIGYRMGRTDERLKHDEAHIHRVLTRAIKEYK